MSADNEPRPALPYRVARLHDNMTLAGFKYASDAHRYAEQALDRCVYDWCGNLLERMQDDGRSTTARG